MLDRENTTDSDEKKRRRPRLRLCLGVAACIVLVMLLAVAVDIIFGDRTAQREPSFPPQAYESLPDVVRLSRMGVEIGGIGDSVTDVNTDGRPVQNEDLACLANWLHLESVLLGGPRLTGAVLQYLPHGNDLRSMFLVIPGLDDRSLAYLSDLPRLWRLEIRGKIIASKGQEKYVPNITDNGLEHIGKIKSLVELSLLGIPVTDTGLWHLSGLVNLEYLELENTRITDAGLVHLSEMNKLGTLELTGAAITDSGLAQLFELSNLEVLGLYRTQITARGVTEILKSKALPNLESLDLRETMVTKVDVVRSQAERPELTIYVGE